MTQPPPPAPGYQQPQPYSSTPYPSAPYGTTAAGAPLVPRTNTLAIVALVLSLTVSLGGIICGHIALSQIKRTGEGGHGLALAGTIIGYVLTAFSVLMIGLYIAVMVAAFSFSGAFSTIS
ncbi:MAG: DUF4190 domain-containing protein [Microbacteriaceae bacterium]|nr:DUF4190 domain-containing protein [Microbacteriaceae bacterium]